MGICLCKRQEKYEAFTNYNEYIELIEEEISNVSEISSRFQKLYNEEYNKSQILNTQTQLLQIKSNLILLSGAIKEKNELQGISNENKKNDFSQIKFILKEYYSMINEPELLYQKESFVKELSNDVYEFVKKIKK